MSDGTTIPAGPVGIVLARIAATARQAVVTYAPAAPDAIHDEAFVRLAGWLYDADPSGSRAGGADGMRASGAASLLAPYHVRRGAKIGQGAATGDALPPSQPGGAGIDPTARAAAAAAQATADGKLGPGDVADWAEEGNTDPIPPGKLGNAPAGGDGGEAFARGQLVATHTALREIDGRNNSDVLSAVADFALVVTPEALAAGAAVHTNDDGTKRWPSVGAGRPPEGVNAIIVEVIAPTDSGAAQPDADPYFSSVIPWMNTWGREIVFQGEDRYFYCRAFADEGRTNLAIQYGTGAIPAGTVINWYYGRLGGAASGEDATARQAAAAAGRAAMAAAEAAAGKLGPGDVADWAEEGNPATIPPGKLPEGIGGDGAGFGAASQRYLFTAFPAPVAGGPPFDLDTIWIGPGPAQVRFTLQDDTSGQGALGTIGRGFHKGGELVVLRKPLELRGFADANPNLQAVPAVVTITPITVASNPLELGGRTDGGYDLDVFNVYRVSVVALDKRPVRDGGLADNPEDERFWSGTAAVTTNARAAREGQLPPAPWAEQENQDPLPWWKIRRYRQPEFTPIGYVDYTAGDSLFEKPLVASPPVAPGAEGGFNLLNFSRDGYSLPPFGVTGGQVLGSRESPRLLYVEFAPVRRTFNAGGLQYENNQRSGGFIVVRVPPVGGGFPAWNLQYGDIGGAELKAATTIQANPFLPVTVRLVHLASRITDAATWRLRFYGFGSSSAFSLADNLPTGRFTLYRVD